MDDNHYEVYSRGVQWGMAKADNRVAELEFEVARLKAALREALGKVNDFLPKEGQDKETLTKKLNYKVDSRGEGDGSL